MELSPSEDGLREKFPIPLPHLLTFFIIPRVSRDALVVHCKLCTGANNGLRRRRNGELNIENIFTGVKIGTEREEKVKYKRDYWVDFVSL